MSFEAVSRYVAILINTTRMAESMLLLELSKLDLGLSLAEACSLLKCRLKGIIENFALLELGDETPVKMAKAISRLAYTRNAYEVLFSCSDKEILANTRAFCFSGIIKGTYKIDYTHIQDRSLKRELNNTVWKSLSLPKVKMRGSEHLLLFLKLGELCFCCHRIWQNTEKFGERAPHMRDGFRPISLNPMLARCLVNLAGSNEPEGIIIDPFMGTGGILIEALLMGMRCEGYDIEPAMCRITAHNLGKLGLDAKCYSLGVRDFLSSTDKMSYSASDLPYGKNTKNIDTKFHERALVQLDRLLLRRAAWIFPHWIDVEKIIREQGLNMKVISKFTQYVHGSMSRIIWIIERKASEKKA